MAAGSALARSSSRASVFTLVALYVGTAPFLGNCLSHLHSLLSTANGWLNLKGFTRGCHPACAVREPNLTPSAEPGMFPRRVCEVRVGWVSPVESVQEEGTVQGLGRG